MAEQITPDVADVVFKLAEGEWSVEAGRYKLVAESPSAKLTITARANGEQEKPILVYEIESTSKRQK